MRLVLVVVALLLFPASAAAAPPDLGDTPWKCGHGVFAGGVSGCYGRDTGDPLAMDDAAVGDVVVSPKVAQLGDIVTVSAAHLPGWNPTGWPASAGGLSRRGTCDAAATTCTYLAVGVTNAWVRFGMTFASFATAVEQDYYAIVSEGRAITGRVQRRDPRDATRTIDAAGVKVSAAGPTPKSVTTSPAGEYAMLVSDGSYTVTTDGGYCLRSALPACRTTTTVTPAATADWSQPDPVKIEGTVTDEDGKVVRGVTVRADGVGGLLDSEVSNASGRYSLTVPAGAVRVKTDDENVCVKDTTASCERFKDLQVDRASILNWQLKGCVREVSFGSMQAINGCFKKVSDEVWQTDDPYLMNGIDITPDGTATLDGHERRITYGGVDFAIGGESIGNYQGLSLNFNSPTQTIGGSTKGFTFKKIPVPGVSIEVLSEPGKSTLTIKLEGSRNLRALFNDNADNPTCPGKAKLTLTIQTTNATGLGKVGLKADSPQELFCAPQSANQPDNPSAPSAIKLKNLSGDFDFSSGFWSIGAAVEGLPLFGSPNVTLTAKLTFGGDGFSLRGVAASLDGFDKPVGAGAFFQRGGFDASFASENGPFTFKLKAGFSLGPKNPWKDKALPFGFKAPDELVSIDPTLSYTDRDLNPFTIDDTDLAGEGTIKLIDRDFFSGSVHYLPGPAAFTLDGRIGFNDPTGQIFKANGEVKGFIDGTRGILFARGRVYVSLPFMAPVVADLALNTEKSAWSACFSEDDNSHFGAVYHYDSGAFVIGGCDMATYTPKNPVASSAAAGVGKSFTVERGTEMLGVEIAGASSTPRVDVRGPGLSLKRNGSKKRARIIVSEASKTTYLLLTAPRAGRYTLSGSGIKRLRFAGKAPEAKVSGSLSGDACAPTLKWKLTPRADQEVCIVDTGADGSGRVIVPAAGRSGTLKLPGVVGDARRTVSAQVFQGGALRTTVGMGSYSASPSRPSAPTHLRVAASGKQLVISWARACGAARYVVRVGSVTKTVTGTSLSAAVPRKASSVRVTAVGASGVSGGSATAALEASAG